MKKSLNKSYWLLLIFPFGVLIDLLTKWWAYVKLDTPITIIKNFFSFELVFNKGAAWGVLIPRWLLISISLAATIGFLFYFFKCKGSTLMKISIVLAASGSFGNFIDRAFYSCGVIDFIAFKFGSYHFPVFNIADSLVVVGIILLLITTLIEDKKNGIQDK